MTSEASVRRQRPRLAGAALLVCLVALAAGPAIAERAWIKDENRINLRTGPGTQYRIVGTLETGDVVEIVSRGDKWTEVKPETQPQGWIPIGYLQAEPPARIALTQREEENARLKAKLAALTESESGLRTANEEISSRDERQQAEITRLTRENLELRAGARWPEWITGAAIVLVGMLLGAAVARSSGRRRTPRIRL